MGEQSITHLSKAEYTLPRRLALMHVNSKKALRRPGVPGGVRGTQLCFSVGTRREPRGEGAARGGVRGLRRSGAREAEAAGRRPQAELDGWRGRAGLMAALAPRWVSREGGQTARGGRRAGDASFRRDAEPDALALALQSTSLAKNAASAFMGSPRPRTNSAALSKVRAPTCLAVGGGVRLPRAAVPGEASLFSTRPGRKCPSLTQASAGA